MAITFMTGFEAQTVTLDGITLTGGASYDTVGGNARTGAASGLIVAGGAGTSYFQTPGGNYVHFGIRVQQQGTGLRHIFNAAAAGEINIVLETSNDLSVYLNTTLIGTSHIANNTWTWLGIRQVTGTDACFLQINGMDAVTVAGTTTVTSTRALLGAPVGTETGDLTAYYDDVIIDNAGFLPPSKCGLLLPTADSARTTGWVTGAGGTTALWDAVNNRPPTATTDPGSATSQIRNATSEASASYDATLQTYAVGGVVTGDTILAVQNVIATAAPVTTSAKQGLVGNASNPAITTIALGAGGTAGAFWSGAAAAAYPTGWKISLGTMTLNPSVVVGTAPVMRVTQVTSSTRIADVGFMGLNFAWTPLLPPVPRATPYPQILAQ